MFNYTEYIVARGDSLLDFINDCNLKLAQGWVVIGGVAHDGKQYLQAFVK